MDGECEMGCGGSAGHLVGFGGGWPRWRWQLRRRVHGGDRAGQLPPRHGFCRRFVATKPLPGERNVWAITFSEVVWFAGTLATSGTGEPMLYVLSADGRVVTHFTGSWKNYPLPAGDYYLIIAAGSTSVDQGYHLEMSTAFASVLAP